MHLRTVTRTRVPKADVGLLAGVGILAIIDVIALSVAGVCNMVLFGYDVDDLINRRPYHWRWPMSKIMGSDD